MKRIHYISQLTALCLAVVTSMGYAQIPADTIPSGWNDGGASDPDGTTVTPPTIDPFRPFTPDDLIIPVVPFEPALPAEPAVPLEPFLPGTEKTTVDPAKPGIPTVDNKYALGSIGGSLTVNGLGAAEYSIPIEAPNGGSLMPGISLAYNSQNASNGIVGYGISVAGFSSITRGEKTHHNNNNSIAGVTYTEIDNLFLDGKRLILISGSPCQEGAQYCLEGDPYTKVTAHGTYNTTTANTWFEVKTPDGMTYQYGKTTDSRLSFKNKGGNQRIASWHINRTEDVQGNYMTVSYLQQNYYPYPSSVVYGMNSVKDRGLVNKIEFDYEAIGATASEFFLEDQKGVLNRRISTITTSSNNQIFRKYFLTYDVASDKSLCRFAHLTSIREENGNGESLTPTQLKWQFLPAGYGWRSHIDDPTEPNDPAIKITDRTYMAADLTGDGISDIIRVSSGSYNGSSCTFLFISRSEVTSTNHIKYKAPIVFKLPASVIIPGQNGMDVTKALGGFHLTDLDGDGLNDLVFTEKGYANNTWSNETCRIIYGKDIVEGNTNYTYNQNLNITSTDTSPLYVTCDFNKDGKDEISISYK